MATNQICAKHKNPKVIIISNQPISNTTTKSSEEFSQNSIKNTLNTFSPKPENKENPKETSQKYNGLPQYRKNVNYCGELLNAFFQNEIIKQNIKNSIEEIQLLKNKCFILEETSNEINSQKKKKNRRTADEIEKNFQCPYDKCGKLYGSEVSLNLHIKLKHNGGNKTDREKIARSFFLSKIRGNPVPNVNLNLNLPPNYFENFLQTKGKKLKQDFIEENLKIIPNLNVSNVLEQKIEEKNF